MKRPPIIRCWPLLAALARATVALSASAPNRTPAAFPAPPAQSTPWKVAGKTQLPVDFLSTCTTLFDLGLPDPRTCEYPEITVATGSVWSGDGGNVKAHGWLLPAADAAGPRFAILWNGLIYPAITVGEKADLHADITALIQADEMQRTTFAHDNPGREFSRWATAAPERDAISEKTLLPIKACFLLRLGETALAEKLWTAHMIGSSRHFADHADDPFERLANDWLWARFDRAVTAHMRRDDGSWERWFGFVGPGFIGKVPAAEVIFDLNWGTPISGCWPVAHPGPAMRPLQVSGEPSFHPAECRPPRFCPYF